MDSYIVLGHYLTQKFKPILLSILPNMRLYYLIDHTTFM